MASNQFIAFAIVAVILPTLTMATEYIVGDDMGWTVNYNYSNWASGKTFHVGDTLAFRYKSPHNVYSVGANGFKNCTTEGANKGWNSGNDTITLSSAGKKWYICGYANHCAEKGQKLVITVEVEPPTPTPAPPVPGSAGTPTPAPGSAYGLVSSWYHIFGAAVAVLAMIVA